MNSNAKRLMERVIDMKKSFRVIWLTIPLLWLAFNAAAAPAWNFDAPHGEVNFKIKHIMTYVSGQFEKYGGTVKFDPDDPAGGASLPVPP